MKFKECDHCHIIFSIKSSSIAKYCSPTCRRHYSGGYKLKSQITKRNYQYNDQIFDSGAEVYFAKLCDLHNFKYIRNNGQYKFKYFNTNNNKFLHYYPDFYMTDLDMYIEIKGKRFLNQSTYDKLGSTDKECLLIMYDKIKKYFD